MSLVIWGGANVVIIEIKAQWCAWLIPKSSSHTITWKNCLPWNQSLMPKIGGPLIPGIFFWGFLSNFLTSLFQINLSEVHYDSFIMLIIATLSVAFLHNNNIISSTFYTFIIYFISPSLKVKSRIVFVSSNLSIIFLCIRCSLSILKTLIYSSQLPFGNHILFSSSVSLFCKGVHW